MELASKRKSIFAWLLALLVVTGVFGENRAWAFFASPEPTSGVFESITPSAVGENDDALRYDAPGYAVAPIRGAGDDAYGLALGVTQHPGHSADKFGLLFRFRDKLDDSSVLHYWEIIGKKGMPNAPVGAQLERQLVDFMGEAKHLHMNLDGVVVSLDRASLQTVLRLGEGGTAIPQNTTRWEFFQVWNNFRGKATFYFDGKDVDLTKFLD